MVLIQLKLVCVRSLKPAPRSRRGRKAPRCYPRAPRDWWGKTRALKLVQLPGPAPGAPSSSPRLSHNPLPARLLSPRPALRDESQPGRRGFSPPRPFRSRFGRRRQREKSEGGDERGAWLCVGVGCDGELGAARRRAVAAAAAARSRHESRPCSRQAAL